MIYRARAVVTMDGPPIEDGAVVIEGSRIASVDRYDERMGPAVDLGERMILPGLINAHCHLDYSTMRGAIAPGKNFAEWIMSINALKRSLDDEDYLQAIAAGFDQLKKWGTTSVLNIESFPELMLQMPAPPIRAWWFWEMIDLRSRIATKDVVAGALLFFQGNHGWPGGFGLSPHSPYTASAELYRLANATGLPITTHLAESVEEDRMFRSASGPLYDLLASLGRDMSDCGAGSSISLLARHGLIHSNWILVHLNELEEEDFTALAAARPHVVHCPRSHGYFGHRPFAFRRLRELGLNICLGTDSLASNQSLNLFSELRVAQKNAPLLSPVDLLEMVTVNPARALSMENQLGKITPGALADLIAIPFSGPLAAAHDEIIHHQGEIGWLMVDGRVLDLEPF
jgi:cytosine/adenosine deaminase-related metal-dependent hydrolase